MYLAVGFRPSFYCKLKKNLVAWNKGVLVGKGFYIKKNYKFLLYRPTNAQHIYINNNLYIVSTATCFNVSAKVTKIIKFTNSIKSVD